MYNKEILRTLLLNKNFLTVNEDGKAYKPSDGVFERVADGMLKQGSTISAKHVHTIVNNNCGGIYDAILRSFSIIQ